MNIDTTKIATITFDAEDTFHRVFKNTSEREPEEFNPGFGKGRAHPLTDKDGNSIPTMYVSDSPNGAMVETVLRRFGPGSIPKVPMVMLSNNDLVLLRFGEPLEIANLLDSRLDSVGLERDGFVETSDYDATRIIFEEIHANMPNVQGVVWNSRQLNYDRSMVIFGDRVNQKSLNALSRYTLDDGKGLEIVINLANQLNIQVAS